VASAYVDVFEGAPTNYLKVKARTTPATSTTSKAYFAFDVSGKSANTNINATLSLRRTANSGQQHIQLWVLQQAFPTMDTNLCWGSDINLIPAGVIGAQANDTNSNDMLTNGTYTAKSLGDQLVNGGNVTDDFTIAAPWGQYLFNGKIVFTVTGIPDANSPSGSAGYRVTNAVTLPVLNFIDTLGNQPPSVSSVGNVTMYSHTTTNLSFNVSDDSTSAALLNIVASTSDSAVVTTNFSYTGQGISGSRTVTVLAGRAGAAVVTLTADDGTATNFTQFNVTVLANPTITTPAWTNTVGTNPVTSAFTVDDALFPVSSITNDVTSGNTALVSATNVYFVGTSSNRTVTVQARPDQDGVAVINLIAGDTNGTTTVSYPIVVLPNTNTYFSDHFAYVNGTLDSRSAFLWSERAFGSVSLRANNGSALIRATSSGQSLIAPLVGSPHTSGVIWVGFNAMWTNMPTAANGWFVHLYDSTNINAIARIYAMTNTTSSNTFTLGVANVAGPQPLTNEMSTYVTYKVVLALDADGNGGLFPPLPGSPVSQLWVDPVTTNSPSVIAADQTGVTAGAPINYVGLRQNTGMGDILIDDLKVGASFADVYPPTLVVLTTPIITGVSLVGTNLVIKFTGNTNDLATDFAVVRSSLVNGSYTTLVSNAVVSTITSGNFSADVPLPMGAANFYKIRR
jgi:hypothetical protein